MRLLAQPWNTGVSSDCCWEVVSAHNDLLLVLHLPMLISSVCFEKLF